MTYHPPFARMRQIKRDTVRPERDPAPANVTEALAQTPPEAVYVIEEPTPPEPEPVVVERAIKLPEPEPEPEPEPVEAKAKFNPQMKKSELVVIAANLNIPISDEMTKAQILDALKAAGH